MHGSARHGGVRQVVCWRAGDCVGGICAGSKAAQQRLPATHCPRTHACMRACVHARLMRAREVDACRLMHNGASRPAAVPHCGGLPLHSLLPLHMLQWWRACHSAHLLPAHAMHGSVAASACLCVPAENAPHRQPFRSRQTRRPGVGLGLRPRPSNDAAAPAAACVVRPPNSATRQHTGTRLSGGRWALPTRSQRWLALHSIWPSCKQHPCCAPPAASAGRTPHSCMRVA